MEEIDSVLSRGTSSNQSEDTPLLPQKRPSCWRLLKQRYCSTRKCVSSKPALLILFWSFILVGVVSGFILKAGLLLPEFQNGNVFQLGAYCFVAMWFVLFPLAGCLADIKCGRFKIIVTSSLIILCSGAILIGLVLLIILARLPHIQYDLKPPESIPPFVLLCVLAAAVYLGVTGFTANILQFGMDQLYDSPGEDRSLFIHWYVWVYYVGIAIVQMFINIHYSIVIPRFGKTIGIRLFFNKSCNHFGVLQLIPEVLSVSVVLTVVLCLVKYKRRWFLIEPGRTNPYRLVYRVTKFAWQHKTPVRRSAFTYCEDELPIGLDLGKEKYGGCFTTEEVEDVKAFYGILRVLVSFGAVFFLDIAAYFTMPWELNLGHHYNKGSGRSQTIRTVDSGLIYSLLVVLFIPFHLFFIRPFFAHYIPGMLKRMGLGMVFSVLTIVLALATDRVAHLEHEYNYNGNANASCTVLDIDQTNDIFTMFLLQLSFRALSSMFIYISVFEFICSQSPHSMKGMLIGLLYATKGIYQVFGTLISLPFITLSKNFYPLCGLYYTVVNTAIGLVALLVYVCVARRYQYRERDEPSRIRQYAEEYYSNSHPEEYYSNSHLENNQG